MSNQSENTDDAPTFPSYPKPRGIPIADRKMQAPLIKLSMKMLNKPKVQKIGKPFRNNTKHTRKKPRFY